MQSPAPIDFTEPVRNTPLLAPAARPVPETGFLENFSAVVEEMEIAGNSNAQRRNLGDGYAPLIRALNESGERWEGTVGGERGYARAGRYAFNNPYFMPGQGFNGLPREEEMRDMIFARIRERRTREPGYLPGVPDTADAFEEQINQRNRERLSRIQRVREGATGWGTVGGFLGGMTGSLQDPYTVGTMMIPFGAGRTIFAGMGRAAIGNALVEAALLPVTVDNYDVLGVDLTATEQATMVALAGTFGGAFHGAVVGTARGATALYDANALRSFNALPEEMQRARASEMTIGGVPLTDILPGSMQVGDRMMVDILRRTIPEEAWDPEIRAAVHVVEREEEINAASPFERGPDGDDAHGAGLAAALQRLTDEAPPIVARETSLPRPARTGPASGFVDSFSRYNQNSPGQRPGAPRTYRSGTHAMNGRDYGMPIGTPLVAELDWELVASPRRNDGGRSSHTDTHGKWFSVRYSDGSIHIFRHVSTMPVAQSGRAGEMMARSGNTGIGSSGPHTHRESWAGDGSPIDPQRWIDGNRGGATRQASAGGSDAALKAVMRHGESRGDDNARNPMPGQTAAGRYGFTDDTWVSLHRRAYPGNMSRAQRLGERSNGDIQERVMDEALVEYRRVYSRAGIDATPANLYLAHYLSPQDAIKVIRDPGARLDATLAQRHSPAFVDQVFSVNRLRRDMTNGQVIAEMQRRTASVGNEPAAAPVERAVDDGAGGAAIAEMEAMAAARETLDAPPASRSGDEIDEAITGLPPTLRRDLFDSDEAWLAAQSRADREFAGMEPPTGGPAREALDAAPGARATDSAAPAASGTAVDLAAPPPARGAPYLDWLEESHGTRRWMVANRLGSRQAEKYDLAVPARRSSELNERWNADNDWKDGMPPEGWALPNKSTTPEERRPLVSRIIDRAEAGFYGKRSDAVLASYREELGKIDAHISRAEEAARQGDLGLSGIQSASRRSRLSSGVASRAIIDEPALKRFDDPAGDGATIQADSLIHDLRAAIAADPTLGERPYRISDESDEMRPLSEILDNLDSDVAAAAAIKACLK